MIHIQLLALKIAFAVVVISVVMATLLTAWLGLGWAVIAQGTVKR